MSPTSCQLLYPASYCLNRIQFSICYVKQFLRILRKFFIFYRFVPNPAFYRGEQNRNHREPSEFLRERDEEIVKPVHRNRDYDDYQVVNFLLAAPDENAGKPRAERVYRLCGEHPRENHPERVFCSWDEGDFLQAVHQVYRSLKASGRAAEQNRRAEKRLQRHPLFRNQQYERQLERFLDEAVEQYRGDKYREERRRAERRNLERQELDERSRRDCRDSERT